MLELRSQSVLGRLSGYVPALYLIAANLFAIGIAYYLEWNQGELLLLYWSESAVIGFFTIINMLLAKPAVPRLRETGKPQGQAASRASLTWLPRSWARGKSEQVVWVLEGFIELFHHALRRFMVGHLIFLSGFSARESTSRG